MKMSGLICIFLMLMGWSCMMSQKPSEIYMFCYFRNNGEDGLHFAYSRDGYTWEALRGDSSFLTPIVGKDKLMRDPCIIKGPDGLFHMVWTVSWKERGIGYANSKDLIHWSEQQYIPVMEHEPGAQNCWAPEIYFDKPSKQYIIFWATTIPGRFPDMDSAGDNNHRIYYVTTKDHKKYSTATIFYNQGFNVIDATLQKFNNQYILFLKDETLRPPQKNIRVAVSNSLVGGYGKPSEPITGKYWAEGPTAIYINGAWIVYFDKYADHNYGAVTSMDLTHWTDISDKVHFPQGTRHGTIFTITAKEYEKLTHQ